MGPRKINIRATALFGALIFSLGLAARGHLDGVLTYYSFLPAFHPTDRAVITGKNGRTAQRVQINFINSRGEETHVYNAVLQAEQPFKAVWTNQSQTVEPYLVFGLGLERDTRGFQIKSLIQKKGQLSAVLDQRVLAGILAADQPPGAGPVGEKKAVHDFQSFPNPVRSGDVAQLAYSVSGDIGKMTIEVWSSGGQLLKSQTVTNVSSTGRGFALFHSEGLATGVYLMRLVIDEDAHKEIPFAVVGGGR